MEAHVAKHGSFAMRFGVDTPKLDKPERVQQLAGALGIYIYVHNNLEKKPLQQHIP